MPNLPILPLPTYEEFLQNQVDQEIVRLGWVILVSKVDKINLIEGCGPKVLIPLPEILTIDYHHVMELLDRMKIPNDS